MDYRRLPFGSGTVAPVRDLARLHLALLPTSPIALLGSRFMQDFYYRVLPREGLVFGAVAYVDQQPAGFIAATHDRAGFMRTAVKRRWPRLMWVIGGSVLTAPKSLGAVWQAWQVMSSRRPAAGEHLPRRILSLGVLPAYREARFIRQSGLHIATDLLDVAVGGLRGMGIQHIGAAVRADNTEAKLFYAGLGWRLHGPSAAGRWPAAVEFRWRRAGRSTARDAAIPASSVRR